MRCGVREEYVVEDSGREEQNYEISANDRKWTNLNHHIRKSIEFYFSLLKSRRSSQFQTRGPCWTRWRVGTYSIFTIPFDFSLYDTISILLHLFSSFLDEHVIDLVFSEKVTSFIYFLNQWGRFFPFSEFRYQQRGIIFLTSGIL